MSQNMKIIGEISFNSSSIVNNTHFYDGKFRNTEIIKVRVLKDEDELKEDQLKTLLKLKSHPNVQRLFKIEYQEPLHYLALQTYDITLKDYIIIEKSVRKKIEQVAMIKDIIEGLKFLHENNIIHGNISPSNVGIDYKKKCLRLCNYGLDSIQEDVRVIFFL